VSSARAALELSALGFKAALPLLGGLAGWQESGYPVVLASEEQLEEEAGGRGVQSVLLPPPAVHVQQ
jgi:3-mercaptopyruvate sulfurtransferase SseA